MELPLFATHHTLSPSVLLVLSLALTVIVGFLAWRQPLDGFVAAITATALLVFIAGAHLPVVSSIAPQSVCFGDPGVAHVIAFALPLLAPAILGLRRRTTNP